LNAADVGIVNGARERVMRGEILARDFAGAGAGFGMLFLPHTTL
jgi:hypothetical protein